jgi:murein DD-endopeptidase MepM/ murein hydrolase activator NlpD
LPVNSRVHNARRRDKFRGWFCDRQVIVRKGGEDRVIAISKRAQVGTASVAVALLAGLVSVGSSAVVERFQMNAQRAHLLQQEAQVTQAQQHVQTFRDELDAATAQLERRQAFLEEMVEVLPADLLAEAALEGEAAQGSDAAGADLEQISAVLPEAAELAELEQRQLASVALLTRFAEGRAARAEAAIRGLGLDPSRMMVPARQAMGGPLEALTSEPDGSLDPRFERLGQSLAKMAALEQGLESIPQVMPADLARMTSSFGYRRDPFTGEAALHSGLDFGGRHGDPIHAAADGKVTYVGNKAGYGKVVEITHGNGLLTRYAHMSAWNARVGQEVEAGDLIGAIGSTGRSTGPHLHFEVRIGGRAVNPRPFLENAPELIAAARS